MAKRKPGRPQGLRLPAEDGQRIKDRLAEFGWRQEGLADRLGLSREHVSKVINGKDRISAPKLRLLAAVLGLRFPDLLVQLEFELEIARDFIHEAHEAIESNGGAVRLRAVLEPLLGRTPKRRELLSLYRTGASAEEHE